VQRFLTKVPDDAWAPRFDARRPAGFVMVWLALAPILLGGCAKTLPKPVGRINDFAAILDEPTERQLDALLDALEKQTTAEVAVATVSSLEGLSLEDYANTLFNQWGVGQKGKDNGVLVVVVPRQREMRIEVGYGLEGVLPDGLAGEIIRNDFGPRFKQGEYNAGVVAGVTRIANIVSGRERVAAGSYRAVESGRMPAVVWWMLFLVLTPIIGLAALGFGGGIRHKDGQTVIVGLLFAGGAGLVANLLGERTWTGLMAFALVMFIVGLFSPKPSPQPESVPVEPSPEPQPATDRASASDSGWWAVLTRSSRSSGSSGSSGSSSGFGGGRSGGGGASGKW
jgi:uncharacterized protein